MMTFLAATEPGQFAAKLKGMLWQAYGAPIKFVAIVALVVFVGMPLLAFVRRLLR